MGDRVNCTLTIGGEIDAADLAILAKVINDLGPEEYCAATPAQILTDGEAFFAFHEVNNGDPDEALLRLLRDDLQLPFIWTWDEGVEFGAGCLLHDPKAKASVEYPVSDHMLCVFAFELEEPGAVEAALRWRRFMQELEPLKVADDVIPNAGFVPMPITGDMPPE